MWKQVKNIIYLLCGGKDFYSDENFIDLKQNPGEIFIRGYEVFLSIHLCRV